MLKDDFYYFYAKLDSVGTYLDFYPGTNPADIPENWAMIKYDHIPAKFIDICLKDPNRWTLLEEGYYNQLRYQYAAHKSPFTEIRGLNCFLDTFELVTPIEMMTTEELESIIHIEV